VAYGSASWPTHTAHQESVAVSVHARALGRKVHAVWECRVRRLTPAELQERLASLLPQPAGDADLWGFRFAAGWGVGLWGGGGLTEGVFG
jgi:hypothetical protein